MITTAWLRGASEVFSVLNGMAIENNPVNGLLNKFVGSALKSDAIEQSFGNDHSVGKLIELQKRFDLRIFPRSMKRLLLILQLPVSISNHFLERFHVSGGCFLKLRTSCHVVRLRLPISRITWIWSLEICYNPREACDKLKKLWNFASRGKRSTVQQRQHWKRREFNFNSDVVFLSFLISNLTILFDIYISDSSLHKLSDIWGRQEVCLLIRKWKEMLEQDFGQLNCVLYSVLSHIY